MRYRLRTLLIVLADALPAVAWGKSERHDYRERQQLRRAAATVEPQLKPQNPPQPWRGFILDVF
jgi:hypothetical protein